MKNFLLLGVAGYIAPRHLKAIKDSNSNLVAAMDISDSVGILDSYFPNANFFTSLNELKTFIRSYFNEGGKIDYMSICTPNYLHLQHIKLALENNINVICEKPLVLNNNQIEILKELESKSSAKVYSILQLRLHPSIIRLKEKILSTSPSKVFEADLTYMTSRGKWYSKSWKGSESKSGGVATNIGVHFFDMLFYIFGGLKNNEIHYRDQKTVSGYLQCERANIKWFLSIDENNLPENAIKGEKLTYRSINIDNEEIEFSSGFTDLHSSSYKNILDGNGFGIDENKFSIDVVDSIRTQHTVDPKNNGHPLLDKMLGK